LWRKITTTIYKTVQAAKRFQIVLTEEIRAICPLYMPLDKCLEMCGDELATRYEIATEVITALENQAVSQGATAGRSREKSYGETHRDLGRQARCDDERTSNRYLHHGMPCVLLAILNCIASPGKGKNGKISRTSCQRKNGCQEERQ
jgi:hypothetical protein